jgi:DNA transformation protein
MILAEAGIRTISELRELGAVKAYARAKALHPKSVSLNLLWGLAAGLEDRDWRELSATDKARLKGEAAKALRFR